MSKIILSGPEKFFLRDSKLAFFSKDTWYLLVWRYQNNSMIDYKDTSCYRYCYRFWTTSSCFLMILSKVLPLTANNPYLTSSLFFRLTMVFKLIHKGMPKFMRWIPEIIYNMTEPRLQTSMTQGSWYSWTYSNNLGIYSS